MYIYIYTHTYTHTHTCIHTYNHTYMHAYIHTYTRPSIHPSIIHPSIHPSIHTSATVPHRHELWRVKCNYFIRNGNLLPFLLVRSRPTCSITVKNDILDRKWQIPSVSTTSSFGKDPPPPAAFGRQYLRSRPAFVL